MPSESSRDDRFGFRGARGARARRPVWWGAGLIGLAATLGTGGCARDEARAPVFPVHGQVRFKGAPAPGAFLVFHPLEDAGDEPLRPTGLVAPDGSFALTTYDKDDGAPPGDYAVTVEWRKLVTKGEDAEAGPNILPDRYGRPETTPLKVTIAEEPNDLPPLEVTTK
jgi:hypothetical protein